MFADVDAQCLAYRAAGAIGADHQPRLQALFAGLVGEDQLATASAARTQADEAGRAVAGQVLQLGQPGFQCLAEVARHHYLAEGLTAVIAGLHHHPAEITGAADMDAADRAGRVGQLLHHPQRGQGIDRGRGKAEVALVEYRRHHPARGGLDQAHVQPQPVQRDGQTGTDQSATDDHYVMVLAHGPMIRGSLLRLRGPMPQRNRRFTATAARMAV